MTPYLYKIAPAPLQNVLISGREYLRKRRRYNREFFADLETMNSGNPNEVDTLAMKSFLKHAEKSPFWKERFREYGLNPSAADPISELQKLPILKRQEVDQNVAQIKTPINVKTSTLATSGTILAIQLSDAANHVQPAAPKYQHG